LPTPEEKARVNIDAQLEAAGWVIQDMEQFNRNASMGVAVREFQLPRGPCDYLLFVDGKAAGVVEAIPFNVNEELPSWYSLFTLNNAGSSPTNCDRPIPGLRAMKHQHAMCFSTNGLLGM